MGITKIHYVDKSWNVTVGCTHSGMFGCDFCWAKDLHDMRHKAYLAGKKVPVQYKRPFGEIVLRPDRLNEPLHWHKSCRIFVCSMSDLFHPLVPFDFIDEVMNVITNPLCFRHDFLLFTKRIKRAEDYFSDAESRLDVLYPLRNVQLIVSCSTQKEIDENVPTLLQIPAAVRGISLEPLIEEIYIPQALYNHGFGFEFRQEPGRIQWIIIGCESGKNRRPCKIEWVKDIVRHCHTGDIKVYVKQLDINGKVVIDINKFPEDLRIREYPD